MLIIAQKGDHSLQRPTFQAKWLALRTLNALRVSSFSSLFRGHAIFFREAEPGVKDCFSLFSLGLEGVWSRWQG